MRTNVPHAGRMCGDVLGDIRRCASVPRSEGPRGNYSIAAPCVHLAPHALSCMQGRAVRTALLLVTGVVSQFRNIRRRREIVAWTAVAARKRKGLGGQRAFRVQCEALSQMRNGGRGQGKLARGSLGIAAAPYAQGLRCCLRQGKPDRLREKRHGKQDAVYCRVFAVGIPDVRTDRRASRGSRLLSAICHGGDPPGARSPGRSSLRSWRAGRPLVDGFRGSLRMVPRRFQ
jgi:hypothetical protein